MASLFHHDDFPADVLVSLKGRDNTQPTISVVLPARNEAATVGTIVSTIYDELVAGCGLVDELVVLDDNSTDDTAVIASNAGAMVLSTADIAPDFNRVRDGVRAGGKGEALWKSLQVTTGDLVIWCDADIRNFDTRFIRGGIGPLLSDPSIDFIKGFYERPPDQQGVGGGRVTELVARPLISTLFAHLGHIVQPLSGEFGGRRHVLEAVPFSRGYAVDLALLIDISQKFGTDAIGQVDLGTRIHRSRPLSELGPQAGAIMAMAQSKATGTTVADDLLLYRPTFGDHVIQLGELPPVETIGTSSA